MSADAAEVDEDSGAALEVGPLRTRRTDVDADWAQPTQVKPATAMTRRALGPVREVIGSGELSASRRYPHLRRPPTAVAAGLAVALLCAACGSGPARKLSASSPTSSTGPSSLSTAAVTTTYTTGTEATTTSAPTTTSQPVPAFTVAVSDVSAAQLGATWHGGCPVGPDQLRQLALDYWGFDGVVHRGVIVVNDSVVSAVTKVFATLYSARFPLQEVVPESQYGGNDNSAAAADDTSGFNCRDAVAPGPPQWSVHAYGEAIDVNDVQNPYVDGSTVIPPAGAAYENRGDLRPGMATPGGVLVNAFASVGWQWGGRWTSSPDYQHFSATGG